MESFIVIAVGVAIIYAVVHWRPFGQKSVSRSSNYEHKTSHAYGEYIREKKKESYSHDENVYKKKKATSSYSENVYKQEKETSSYYEDVYNRKVEEYESKIKKLERELRLEKRNSSLARAAERNTDKLTEIKRAFTKLYHPDNFGSSEFEKIIRTEIFKEFWAEIERIEKS